MRARAVGTAGMRSDGMSGAVQRPLQEIECSLLRRATSAARPVRERVRSRWTSVRLERGQRALPRDVYLRFKPALCFECGHATRSGSRDGLPPNGVLHVATGTHAGDRSLRRAGLHQQVALARGPHTDADEGGCMWRARPVTTCRDTRVGRRTRARTAASVGSWPPKKAVLGVWPIA